MTEELDAAVREHFRSNHRDITGTLDAVLDALRLEGAEVRRTATVDGHVVMSARSRHVHGQPAPWVPSGVSGEAWVEVGDTPTDRILRSHHNAWGRRTASTVRRYHGAIDVGRINPVAVQAGARVKFDRYVPTQRQVGGWSTTAPYYMHYSYYRQYGNAGRNAVTAHVHNFPSASVPIEK